MNDAQLRDLMTSAYDAVPPAPSPLDPDADLGRGRTARGRRRARLAGAGAVLAVAALAAGAAIIQSGGGAARVPATPGPTPMVTTTAADDLEDALGVQETLQEYGRESMQGYGQAMERSLREHLVDADAYLGAWDPETGLRVGGTIDAQGSVASVDSYGIDLRWSQEGTRGAVRLTAARLEDGDDPGWMTDEAMCEELIVPELGGTCSRVSTEGGVRVYHAQQTQASSEPGSTAVMVTGAARGVYPDGSTVTVMVQNGTLPGTTSTAVPAVPGEAELTAVVRDPDLAWPGPADAGGAASSDPSAASSDAAGATVTPTEYGRRMEDAVRSHLSGAPAYLQPWEPPTGEVWVGATPGGPVDVFAIKLSWSEQVGDDSGYVVVTSHRPMAAEDVRTAEEKACDFLAGNYGVCSKAEGPDGIRVFHGESDDFVSAIAVYPDGRQVRVIVEGGAAGGAGAPLPTTEDVIGLATDTAIAWPGEVEGPHPFIPGVSILEQHQVDMEQWENLTGNG